MGLAGFYAARLDEEEAAARGAASTAPWSVSETNDDGTRSVEPTEAADGLWHGDVAEHIAGADARHIARHDPARVLREVVAKRAILAAYEAVLRDSASIGDPARRPRLYGEHDGLRIAVAHLAAIYSDHPDYDLEWKP